MEKDLECEFIRINPVGKDFNIFEAINEIHRHVKISTRKSLIDEISEKLLGLKLKSNNSIQTKFLKYFAKKILPTL